MYQGHWGLENSPFGSARDARRFHESPTHEEALARLHFLVEQRRRLGLLQGPAGSGKSLLLDVFADELRQTGRPVAQVSLVGVDVRAMLFLLAGELAVGAEPEASLMRLWRAVTDRLAEYRYRQLDAVLLFDDVDQAEPAVVDHLIRLVQHDTSGQARTLVVLAGRADGIARLNRRLLELVELRVDVELWEPLDTKEYVEQSLKKAGCQASVFAEPAITRLHELSGGIPRRVAQLADLSLLAGAGAELPQIDAAVVETVHRELAVR